MPATTGVVGLALVALGAPSVASNRDGAIIGAPMIALGCAIILGSLIGYVSDNSIEPAAATKHPVQEQRGRQERELKIRQSHRLATALAQQATHLATDGDCAAVKDVEDRVCELDPAFHDVVFMRVASIARCVPPTSGSCTVLVDPEHQTATIARKACLEGWVAIAKRAQNAADPAERARLARSLPDCDATR